jgi:uncharacterized membrane protein
VYTALKLVHVIAAIVWLGAGTLFLILNLRLARSRDLATAAALGQHGAALGARLFMPASIVTLLAGVGMVLVADQIGFTELWILAGLAGVLTSGVIGSIVGRTSEGVAPLVEAGDSEGVRALQSRMQTLGAVDLTLLYLVVVAMVYKPGA